MTDMQTLNLMETKLKQVNGRRRLRRLEIVDVKAVVAGALQEGVAWMTGGNVDSNSYGYPVTCVAMAAVQVGRRGVVAVKFGSANARKGHSPVTWFGPDSTRHVPEWAKTVTAKTLREDGWIFLNPDLAKAVAGNIKSEMDVCEDCQS